MRADLPPLQVAAEAPPPPPRLAPAVWLVAEGSSGVAYARGLGTGGYGRIGFEMMVAPRQDRLAPVWGVGDGIEGWGAGRQGGV